MCDTNSIPIALAEREGPDRGVYTWRLIACPYCGTRHIHGAGTDGTSDGHRISHCVNGDNAGYIIRDVHKAPGAIHAH